MQNKNASLPPLAPKQLSASTPVKALSFPLVMPEQPTFTRKKAAGQSETPVPAAASAVMEEEEEKKQDILVETDSPSFEEVEQEEVASVAVVAAKKPKLGSNSHPIDGIAFSKSHDNDCPIELPAKEPVFDATARHKDIQNQQTQVK